MSSLAMAERLTVGVSLGFGRVSLHPSHHLRVCGASSRSRVSRFGGSQRGSFGSTGDGKASSKTRSCTSPGFARCTATPLNATFGLRTVRSGSDRARGRLCAGPCERSVAGRWSMLPLRWWRRRWTGFEGSDTGFGWSHVWRPRWHVSASAVTVAPAIVGLSSFGASAPDDVPLIEA